MDDVTEYCRCYPDRDYAIHKTETRAKEALTEPLLATKFHIPSARPNNVSRPRLVEKLNQGLHRPFTLISAPAGFGKTTLVAEWLESINNRSNDSQTRSIQIVWLSIDDRDTDPNRFLTYFITALKEIGGMETDFGESALNRLAVA